MAQLGLFVVYSAVSWKAAEKKAERNKEMMMAMMSEWGKIMATAGSYERAHFFSNVEHEVDKSRECFAKIGSKMTATMIGEHWEAMTLQAVSLVVTIGFIFVRRAHSNTVPSGARWSIPVAATTFLAGARSTERPPFRRAADDPVRDALVDERH
jgi:hypothetical protein